MSSAYGKFGAAAKATPRTNRWGKLTRVRDNPNVRSDGLFNVQTISALQNEVYAARAKFPTNRPLLIATIEELGELAKALAHGTREQVEAEALQVASTALRIFEEGDASFDELTPAERKP